MLYASVFWYQLLIIILYLCCFPMLLPFLCLRLACFIAFAGDAGAEKDVTPVGMTFQCSHFVFEMMPCLVMFFGGKQICYVLLSTNFLLSIIFTFCRKKNIKLLIFKKIINKQICYVLSINFFLSINFTLFGKKN